MLKRKLVWNAEDDNILQESVRTYITEKLGRISWKAISEICIERGLNRKPTQCQQRWKNYVDPFLSKEKMGPSDILMIFQYYKVFGSKWSMIADKFNEKSAALIKNTFFHVLRKAIRQLYSYTENCKIALQLNKIQPNVLNNFLTEEIEAIPVNSSKTFKVIDFILIYIRGGIEEVRKLYPQNLLEVIHQMFDGLLMKNESYIKIKKLLKVSRIKVNLNQTNGIYQELKSRLSEKRPNFVKDNFNEELQQEISLLQDVRDKSTEQRKQEDDYFSENTQSKFCQFENSKNNAFEILSHICQNELLKFPTNK